MAPPVFTSLDEAKTFYIDRITNSEATITATTSHVISLMGLGVSLAEIYKQQFPGFADTIDVLVTKSPWFKAYSKLVESGLDIPDQFKPNDNERLYYSKVMGEMCESNAIPDFLFLTFLESRNRVITSEELNAIKSGIGIQVALYINARYQLTSLKDKGAKDV